METEPPGRIHVPSIRRVSLGSRHSSVPYPGNGICLFSTLYNDCGSEMSDGGGTPGPTISQLCDARQAWEGGVSVAAVTSRPVTLSSLSSWQCYCTFEDYLIQKNFLPKSPNWVKMQLSCSSIITYMYLSESISLSINI